jgi:hypothetical protein
MACYKHLDKVEKTEGYREGRALLDTG